MPFQYRVGYQHVNDKVFTTRSYPISSSRKRGSSPAIRTDNAPPSDASLQRWQTCTAVRWRSTGTKPREKTQPARRIGYRRLRHAPKRRDSAPLHGGVLREGGSRVNVFFRLTDQCAGEAGISPQW